jgi:hypothetical protein
LNGRAGILPISAQAGSLMSPLNAKGWGERLWDREQWTATPGFLSQKQIFTGIREIRPVLIFILCREGAV